ncbi:hypothetical protein B5X24_HaOG211964 [Helicoverpa armigera]|uniref:Uncharacterized protein n=1 Tax=Helicoverpa armigera TaxID=29058 RepID=A0A2W1B8T1_HELAM|nr:hypothetical protein B5X24_HaOG211964 [Helicoverpa armigera]
MPRVYISRRKENVIAEVSRLKGKGIGKKSKPLKCNINLNKESGEQQQEEQQEQEKQILEEQQQQNFDIDLTDIDNIPVLLLDDNFTLTENNCIVTKEHSALLEDNINVTKDNLIVTEGHSALLEENINVTEDNFIVTEDHRQKNTQPKIRILSDVIYKPKPSTSGLRRPSYYKDDVEILRDLMDSDEE